MSLSVLIKNISINIIWQIKLEKILLKVRKIDVRQKMSFTRMVGKLIQAGYCNIFFIAMFFIARPHIVY